MRATRTWIALAFLIGSSTAFPPQMDAPDRKNDSADQLSFSETENTVESPEIERKTRETIYSVNQIISVSNPNDEPIKQGVTRSVPIYLSPLTFNSPAPDNTKIVDARKIMEWDLQVPANSEETVRSSLNYLIFFGGIGAILLGLIGIKTLKKSIRIEKEVKNQENELKVIIHLENHTNRTYENLSVKDFIPSVLETEEFRAGKPKVTKTENGTKLEWEIDEVQPGEDRKLIYTMKPDFSGTSEIHLPEAELITDSGEVKESSQKNFEVQPDEV